MAPPRISSPAEYDAFIKKLAAYHEKRGTHFEPNPKVGNKPIDLLQLFNAVVEHGGYDRVSDEKLAWRKISTDFGLPTANLPAVAFSLKTVFYKNLAAYEISTVHGREPPPREILEDITAKGAALLSRTLENYRPSARREAGALGNENSEASGDDGTPARDRNGSEETPGSGGRVTRGLRQAPPQRILFQPDVGPSRPSRNVSATSHAPSPQHANHQHHQQQQPRGASTSYNPSSNTENMSLAVANYEPRMYHPLTLRPVITPGNNPVEFARRQKALKDAAAGKPLVSKQGGIMLPGTGFDGPNIYVRCLCALRSGIPSEQDYALHHLVKISMERGDKYRFEGFPGLAEALVEKVLEVASLFYKVDWQVAHTEDELIGTTTLNGIDGTPDILQRISSLQKREVDDNIQTAEFADKMLQINEAALTLRNMVMLEDNAYYVSELSSLRDLLSIVLNLPMADSVVELKHYALDIAEQLTKYLHLDENDPLYISLLAQLQSDDRGAILTALRAISRISMNLEENNLLKGVPAPVIQNIIDWTLLNDDDLAHACLDFLYQYTAVVDNVDFLLTHIRVDPLVNQLVRLLTQGAKTIEREFAYGRESRLPPPPGIAALPQDLLPDLLKLEEPDRSSQWLRCLFEEDPDEAITQIALWQAYQACFTPTVAQTGHPLLPAAEFIKNVSTTFADKAAAQVQPGVVQKFIIKGIRMRRVPVGFNGEEAYGCAWRINSSETCREHFMSPKHLFQHILKAHLGATQNEDGKFENTSGRQYTCLWGGCKRFNGAPATSLLQIANHIKVHLAPKPATRKDTDGQPPAKRLKPSYIISPPKQAFTYQLTATDERNDAAGIPLSAVLVLRNLARNVAKTEAEDVALKGEGGVSWVDRLFKPVEQRLFEVMTHNKSLTIYMTDLLNAIKDS
ncbi:hypothetical protein BDZ45DRAFT_623031 [Acephala macrosclerotiorum]|nr:hypothetical protein BDZ45DRAFT_623031 [Acephala macrosclerotiorum]